jgi:hypothetical protein
VREIDLTRAELNLPSFKLVGAIPVAFEHLIRKTRIERLLESSFDSLIVRDKYIVSNGDDFNDHKTITP